MCNWFFIAKCIGHYVLDFVLANVLLAGCWLLAAFAFFFLFLLRFQKGYTDSQKNGPKKVGPLYSLPPLVITWGSELTLFTTPLLIASGHWYAFWVAGLCSFCISLLIGSTPRSQFWRIQPWRDPLGRISSIRCRTPRSAPPCSAIMLRRTSLEGKDVMETSCGGKESSCHLNPWRLF